MVHVRTSPSTPGMSPLSGTGKGAQNKRMSPSHLRPSLRKVCRRNFRGHDWKVRWRAWRGHRTLGPHVPHAAHVFWMSIFLLRRGLRGIFGVLDFWSTCIDQWQVHACGLRSPPPPHPPRFPPPQGLATGVYFDSAEWVMALEGRTPEDVLVRASPLEISSRPKAYQETPRSLLPFTPQPSRLSAMTN